MDVRSYVCKPHFYKKTVSFLIVALFSLQAFNLQASFQDGANKGENLEDSTDDYSAVLVGFIDLFDASSLGCSSTESAATRPTSHENFRTSSTMTLNAMTPNYIFRPGPGDDSEPNSRAESRVDVSRSNSRESCRSGATTRPTWTFIPGPGDDDSRTIRTPLFPPCSKALAGSHFRSMASKYTSTCSSWVSPQTATSNTACSTTALVPYSPAAVQSAFTASILQAAGRNSLAANSNDTSFRSSANRLKNLESGANDAITLFKPSRINFPQANVDRSQFKSVKE